jgi:hypothetical protein
VHDLVDRVFVLTGRDVRVTQEVLDATGPSGESAFSLLVHDRPADAYLAVIDTLRPQREGLITGFRPAVGNATAALINED